jgi:hypothetical protein
MVKFAGVEELTFRKGIHVQWRFDPLYPTSLHF